MARKCKHRQVQCEPTCCRFGPQDAGGVSDQVVCMTVDELEAIRLVDLDGLYQEAAADELGVSRQTLGNIVKSARRKIAEAIVQGRELTIQGGVYQMCHERKFECCDCSHEWNEARGTGRPSCCPECKCTNIHRTQDNQGHNHGCGSGRGHGHGHGCCGGKS